jgi:hypothetical protein
MHAIWTFQTPSQTNTMGIIQHEILLPHIYPFANEDNDTPTPCLPMHSHQFVSAQAQSQK